MSGERKMLKRERIGQMSGLDEDKIDKKLVQRFQTVPQHRWDASKAIIDKYWEEPRKGNKDRRISILGEHQLPAIASKERLRIIQLLKRGGIASMQELAEKLGRDQAAVSRDISILEENGIVKKVRTGKTIMPTMANDVVLLPLFGTDLLEMLGEGSREETAVLARQNVEKLMALSYVYDMIFPKLDKKMRGHRNLTIVLTSWILQELNEIPDRLVKRIETVPDECWYSVEKDGQDTSAEPVPKNV